MKNYKQPGKTMAYVAGADISAGDVVALADRVAVALTDIANGATGTVELDGVYELVAETDAAFSQGDQLFWDTNAENLTKTPSTTTIPAGMAHEAKVQASAKALCRLQASPKRAAYVADASSGSAGEINAIRDALVNAGLMKGS